VVDDLGLVRKIIAWALILLSLLFLFASISLTAVKDYGSAAVGIVLFFIPFFAAGLKLRKEPKKKGSKEVIPQQPSAQFIYCKNCGKMVSNTFSNCPYCNTVLSKQ